MRVVDLSADFRLARPRRCTSAGTGRTARPSCVGEAVFGLTELHRDEIAAREPGRQPRLLLDRRDPGAGAARARGADRGRRRGREERRVRRRPRARPTRTHFVSVDENVSAYAVDGHRHAPEIDQELAALGCDARVTFMPHLLPLDQGLLASCYVTPTRAIDADERRGPVRRVLRRRAVHRAGRAPPGVRDVRDTNLCRIHATSRAGRARGRVRRDRQPLEGRRGPGGAEPERDARRSTRRRACGERPNGTFFRSRWVRRPGGVDRARAGRAAARLPRVRPCLRDQALRPPRHRACWPATRRRRRRRRCSRATRSWRRRWRSRARPTSSRLRAVVVNSGNANVGTEEQGRAVARGDGRRGRRRARASSARASGVASTGVIGVPLDMERRRRAALGARPRSSPRTAARASRRRS